MSIEIQCMTEKLIIITIKLDYSKVLSKSTVPTYGNTVGYSSGSLEFIRFDNNICHKMAC